MRAVSIYRRIVPVAMIMKRLLGARFGHASEVRVSTLVPNVIRSLPGARRIPISSARYSHSCSNQIDLLASAISASIANSLSPRK